MESKTPGHPERGHTEGVEVTTGPLGQGLAMAVGMAIAEKHLAAIYNRPGFAVVDHHTFALLGDGDLMEGVSHEAAALAGTLGLGKLVFLYDDNLISLDGPTSLNYTDDALKRFEAYHWHVQRVADGNDLKAIEAAIEAAKAETGKPSIIAVRTIIGYGSPKAGSNKSHGEPLGTADVAETTKFFGFPEGQSFVVPENALANWRQAVERGAGQETAWKALFAGYAAANPELAAEFERGWILLRRQVTVARVIGATVLASISFFLVSNYAVWVGGAMYPHTMAGLGASYLAGLPFYRNDVLSTGLITGLAFGLELAVRAHALRAKTTVTS